MATFLWVRCWDEMEHAFPKDPDYSEPESHRSECGAQFVEPAHLAHFGMEIPLEDLPNPCPRCFLRVQKD